MTTWTLRTTFVVLLLAFPAFMYADMTNMSFGTTDGWPLSCTNAFSGYWGYSSLPLTRTSIYAPDGSQSTAFTAYVNTYQVSYGTRPSICVKFNPTVPGTHSAWIDARYGYSGEYIATVYATGNYDPPSGSIRPKYVILSVMYAPPGGSSSVSYGQSTVVGNSTSVSDSFATNRTVTVSATKGFSIFGVAGSTVTVTASGSWTQEKNTASSFEIRKTNQRNLTLFGFSDPVTGLNHNYDEIMVWLNPVLLFRAGTSHVIWEGYGYDAADPTYPDLDVVGVPVGCLTGAFAVPHVMADTCTQVFEKLERRWAQPNEDGSGPGLTGTADRRCVPGSGSDLCNLLAADPLVDPNYRITVSPGSYTTADGRFTACNNAQCNSTINYQPFFRTDYTQRYSTTTTQSQSARTSREVAFSVDASLKLNKFWANFSASLRYAYRTTQTHTSTSGATNISEQSSSFVIVGPQPGYGGPIQFVLYQDNLYGTFAFQAP